MRTALTKKRFQSLASRLSIWILILGGTTFGIVLSVNFYLSRVLLEDYVSDLAKATTTATVQQLDNVFQSVSSSADTLASVVSTTEKSTQQIEQTLQAFINANDAIFGMTVALEPNTLFKSIGQYSPYYYKKDNKLAYSDLAAASYNYTTWPWYRDAKKHNKPIWSEPYLDEGGGNVLMTTYSTPLQLKGTNQFAGVATADIELGWLDHLVKNIRIGDNGFGFIVSAEDIVIAHPNESLNLKKLSDVLDSHAFEKNWAAYQSSKTRGESVYLFTFCRHLGSNCWVAVESLGETGWKVILVLPEKELIKDINTLTQNIAIIAVAGLFALLVVVTYTSRRLTRPLASLAVATRDIGSGNLEAELPQPRRADEIGSLTQDFHQMRSALKDYIAEVQQTTAKQQKLESEIQIAQDIQMSMIPGAGNIHISEDGIQLYAYLRPARSVGGDLYYYQIDENQLHFIIGDVSDKGVPAALFMAKTVTLYTRALKEQLTPGKTFTMMNDILTQNNDACMFVTALCGVLDLSNGKLVMANAGHMDPIITSGDNTQEHKIDGAMALGLMEAVEYPDIELTLEKNSTVSMYTDGISEAHNTRKEQYGDEQLIRLVSEQTLDKLEPAGKNIIESVDQFAVNTEQFDDITLFMLRYE